MSSIFVKIIQANDYFRKAEIQILNNNRFESLLNWARQEAGDEHAFVVYKDSDNDLVRIFNEKDLLMAEKESPVLRIQIRNQDGKPVALQPFADQTSKEVVAETVTPMAQTEPELNNTLANQIFVPLNEEQNASDDEQNFEDDFDDVEHNAENVTENEEPVDLPPLKEGELPYKSKPFNRRGNPHYNNLPFYVYKKKDFKSTQTKKCAYCYSNFVANSTGLDGFYVSHKENYHRNTKDSEGRKKQTTTRRSLDNMYSRWVCVNYTCIMERYPYVGRNLFKVDRIKSQLSPIQLAALEKLGL